MYAISAKILTRGKITQLDKWTFVIDVTWSNSPTSCPPQHPHPQLLVGVGIIALLPSVANNTPARSLNASGTHAQTHIALWKIGLVASLKLLWLLHMNMLQRASFICRWPLPETESCDLSVDFFTIPPISLWQTGVSQVSETFLEYA